MRISFMVRDGVLTYKITAALDALEPEDRSLIALIEKIAAGNCEEVEKCRKGEINTSSPSR